MRNSNLSINVVYGNGCIVFLLLFHFISVGCTCNIEVKTLQHASMRDYIFDFSQQNQCYKTARPPSKSRFDDVCQYLHIDRVKGKN